MKLVYNQPYTRNGKKSATRCYYGKPPKGMFKWDMIRLDWPDNGPALYMTPDEAADLVRALSAGLHHFLVDHPIVKKIVSDKSK